MINETVFIQIIAFLRRYIQYLRRLYLAFCVCHNKLCVLA